MDFSADGCDSWDSTPAQEHFLQNYFKNKLPLNITSSKTKKKKKLCLDSNMPSTSSICKKKDKILLQKSIKNKFKQPSTLKSESDSCTKSDDLNSVETKNDSNAAMKSFKKNKVKIGGPKSYVSSIDNEINKCISKNPLKSLKMKESLKDSINKINGVHNNEDTNKQKNNASKLKTQKKRKLKIKQTSHSQSESSANEAISNIKRVKNTNNSLNFKNNHLNTDDLDNSDNDDSKTPNDDESDNHSYKSCNSEDEEVIRKELQDTPIFKKIQKLMKLAPFLNPNFIQDPKAESKDSSCEDASFEDSSLDSDNESSVEGEEDLSEADEKGDPIKIYSEDLHSSTNNSSIVVDSSNKKNKKLMKSSVDSSSKEQNLSDSYTQAAKDYTKNQTSETSNNQLSSSNLSNSSPSKMRSTEKSNRSSALMQKARAKLAAAKFRFLNEKLYTERGRDAFNYFQENTEEFEDYHLGYGMQVAKWPLNPVNEIISDLQKIRKDAVIADLGCGDAKIARILTDRKVHSFDLVALHDCVISCDMSKVPLPDSSVDVVVFCLSLMGINLVDYLHEAYRILKKDGQLKIAEVESRIEDLDLFIRNLNALGFSLERKNKKNNFFVFLDLKKEKKSKKAKVSNITLRPCLYKKR